MLSRRVVLITAAAAAVVISWAAFAARGNAGSGPDPNGMDWLAEANPPGEPGGPPPPRPGDRGPRHPGGPRGFMGGKMSEEMRPLLGAGAKARVMKEYLGLVGDLQHLVGNPLQSSIMAVYGIVELGKDNSKQAISALQGLLEQTDVLPIRTAIHFGLKEVMEKSGDKEGAIKHLQAVVAENAKAMQSGGMRGGGGGPAPAGGEGRPPRGPRPAEPPPPPPGQ